ncbi:hypothetical protein TthAA37_03300 [Thermus thermophilus]|uniref:Uncharacterized protein n=1 Tax=Thermus thermophilus TaxID=274 RepID=A0AAD1NXM1_THETH|nr:hypothetical protein TthAA220_03020 [Thermus thermophilus]BBL83821.1 hypothetical protein TthAA229_03020 [Thermus thermophilus]BCZ86125.1 hypothetical protein TthAA11_03070 [Thermus thermophilus]BCZ88518.1 hypothetical protein TthAA22_03230 [Thermus thermophilus]BCZ91141.1 hypothetical protein TthAA37_03300 [Thermus thermophilus]
MAAHGFLGHGGTDGSTVRERVKREGYWTLVLGRKPRRAGPVHTPACAGMEWP